MLSAQTSALVLSVKGYGGMPGSATAPLGTKP